MESIASGAARGIPETPAPAPLSEEHRRELEVKSGISPEVIAARGYYTAWSPRDLPDAFPNWQRRPGLVVPGLSPSGKAHHQYKPKTPIRRKSGPGPKYETPQGAGIMLDVNPLMLEEVRSGTGELWITEGCKKVDALASWGIPAVGLTGVYMAAVPKTKGAEPLPCWHHVRLKGRTVIIAFDADAKTNVDVQEALRRLVVMLEALGAVVLVVYVPAVNDDSKAGVDDYKAAGLTHDGLRRRAQPFAPLDVGRERMKRDVRLKRGVANLWRSWREMPARVMAECTDRAALRALILAAGRKGKPEIRDGRSGLLVVLSARDGADDANISLGSWTNAIGRLEAAGRLRRTMWGRAKDKLGAYLLFTSWDAPGAEPYPWGGGRALREQYGRGETPEGNEGQEREVKDGGSFRLSNAAHDRGVHVTRAPSDEVPALRWPKVVHTWERFGRRRVVVDSHYVARLGKRREEIIRYLLENVGASVAELFEHFGPERGRVRDFRRRMLGPLEREGIAAVTGEDVALTPAWREALEEVRERDEELADARRQSDRHAREKKAFRQARKDGWDPTPDLKGRAEVRRVFAGAAERESRERIEEQRRKVGMTCEVFVHDTLARLGRVRFGLLREMWADKGGKRDHVRFAVKKLGYRLERSAAYGGELFVIPGEAPAPAPERQDPAPVVPMHREASPKPPVEPSRRREESSTELTSPADDWRDHALDCGCSECFAPMPTSYVKIGGPR